MRIPELGCTSRLRSDFHPFAHVCEPLACETNSRRSSEHMRLGSTHCDEKSVRGLRKKRPCVHRLGLMIALASQPPPPRMQCWGVHRPCMFIVAFPTCVDQHCLCGGRGGQPTPGGTFFSQTPELVLMKGNNTKWQQAFEYTPRGAGSRVFCLRIPELGCTSSVRSNVTLLRMSANRSPAKPIAGAALNTCAYEPSLHASMRGTRRVPAQ